MADRYVVYATGVSRWFEFEPGYVIGLIRFSAIEAELSDILGRKVDMRTPADLSRYFREEVIEGAEVQYAQE